MDLKVSAARLVFAGFYHLAPGVLNLLKIVKHGVGKSQAADLNLDAEGVGARGFRLPAKPAT